jgi:hypothetical protein
VVVATHGKQSPIGQKYGNRTDPLQQGQARISDGQQVRREVSGGPCGMLPLLIKTPKICHPVQHPFECGGGQRVNGGSVGQQSYPG